MVEKQAYDHLREIQGTVIPVCYGVGTFQNAPALVLGECNGITLHKASYSDMQIPHLFQIIANAFKPIAERGIIHRNLTPHQVVLIEGQDGGYRAMIFGFGSCVYEPNLSWDLVSLPEVRACVSDFARQREMHEESTRPWDPQAARLEYEARVRAARVYHHIM
jgi:RIO-like serine/threonine protein kinase